MNAAQSQVDLIYALLKTVDTQFKRSIVIEYWLDGSITGEVAKTIIEKSMGELAS